MKTLALILCSIILTGCVFGSSSEIKKAEAILEQFECRNIENNQLNHSPIASFHNRELSISKDKVISYIESYKAGDELFRLPLDQVVQQQYEIYKSACEALGGV